MKNSSNRSKHKDNRSFADTYPSLLPIAKYRFPSDLKFSDPLPIISLTKLKF